MYMLYVDKQFLIFQQKTNQWTFCGGRCVCIWETLANSSKKIYIVFNMNMFLLTSALRILKGGEDQRGMEGVHH